MKKFGLALCSIVLLQACGVQSPISNPAVGFSNNSDLEVERLRREAELSGSSTPSEQNPFFTPTGEVPTGGNLKKRVGIQASPANAAPELVGTTDISDEQDFDAVASRETIESDAARRAEQAAARQQIKPTAIPDRPVNTGPNVVEYALSAPNAKGQEWYSRSIFASQRRFVRNCAKYASPDDAQRDFLANGGPESNAKGLDPDGDGFACGWDPAPFKLVFDN